MVLVGSFSDSHIEEIQLLVMIWIFFRNPHIKLTIDNDFEKVMYRKE